MLWFHLCISPITDCPTIHIASSQVVRDECLKRWIYVEKGGAAGYQDSHLGSGYPSGNSGFFFCSKTKTEVHIIQYCYHYKKYILYILTAVLLNIGWGRGFILYKNVFYSMHIHVHWMYIGVPTYSPNRYCYCILHF